MLTDAMGTKSSGVPKEGNMTTLLYIIAAVLVLFGIYKVVRGAILWGIVLIAAGLLVGPGGVSLFN